MASKMKKNLKPSRRSSRLRSGKINSVHASTKSESLQRTMQFESNEFEMNE